ncbi:7-carboxy-7-deazaguanine synthase [Marinobacterium jannaschii]|uniref:7-carboxy-7-deazaguanine synthase n=1 Tax=Marinobacterium jannaschii TaxID=64970 RepID=UPI000483CB1C|nr:7-carboxy-7-deazaguanine synthase [Marinobacterium jannaschii]
MYSIKEMFYSLQGEGAHSGRPAIFCRFTGCNLWSGREQDRAKAICDFCDTDFIGTDGSNGGKFKTAAELAQAILSLWPQDRKDCYVIFTGGEPALQLDDELIAACKALGMVIAIETNGTKPLPNGIDWICVSPKASAEVIIERGNELKLVYPQTDAMPSRFESMQFEHFYLQPMDGPARSENTSATVQYCLENPRWKLSLQTHKIIGIE